MARHDSFQLPLLLDGIAPISSLHRAVAEITWSYSMRSAMEQCARRYYYAYYGANKLTARAEPHKDLLHFLKKIETRHQRTGSILHLAISVYFGKAKQGNQWSSARLIDFATRIFAQDIAFSRANPDGPIPTDQRFPPVLLREFHYRVPDADRLCREAADAMADSLRSFALSDAFQAQRVAGCNPESEVERQFQLRSLACSVKGKADLAFRGDTIVTVVDWKSGAPDGRGNDSLQLATYGLWALEHYKCAPDQIQVHKAYLAAERLVAFPVSDDVLAAARQRIIQDAETMVAVQEYADKGIAAAFSPCLQPRVCSLCAFEKVCYA